MILFLYNAALILTLIVSAPWWIFRILTTQKYREGLRERLGWIRHELIFSSSSRKSGRPRIWIHAVSVGEVLAISRLVKRLDEQTAEVLISTTTRTGQALARERFGAERVFYCPLDLRWVVKKYLDGLQPQLFVLTETEFWPNLLNGCYRRGIPVAVVNARISDRSWPRYRALRSLWKPFLTPLSRVLAQSETDVERLRALGCRAESVSVSGNLKFDVRAAEEAEATRLLRAASAGLRIVVAGSTLEGEESALLAAWPRLLKADPNLLLVLAPRHPERFPQVVALLNASASSWLRRSEWQGEVPNLKAGQIVLLDTIGELASIYSLAAVAFVGGSLIPAGGHNPLEPAQFGVPIVMGPSTHNFRAIVEALLNRQAMKIAGREELAENLAGLLLNSEEAARLGENARKVFAEQAGATERSLAALMNFLPAPIGKRDEQSS